MVFSPTKSVAEQYFDEIRGGYGQRPVQTAEDVIRQVKELREAQGMWPTPRKEGPVPRPDFEIEAVKSLGLDPLDYLHIRNQDPEVYGNDPSLQSPTPPSFPLPRSR